MLLHCDGDLRIIRSLGLSRERTKEDCVGPAEIIQSRIVLFSIPDQCRPEITVRKSMAQGVVHRSSRHFEQLLVATDQRATQGAIRPITFLFPRPPRGIILLACPESASKRSCYFWQMQAQALGLLIQILAEPAFRFYRTRCQRMECGMTRASVRVGRIQD